MYTHSHTHPHTHTSERVTHQIVTHAARTHTHTCWSLTIRRGRPPVHVYHRLYLKGLHKLVSRDVPVVVMVHRMKHLFCCFLHTLVEWKRPITCFTQDRCVMHMPYAVCVLNAVLNAVLLECFTSCFTHNRCVMLNMLHVSCALSICMHACICVTKDTHTHTVCVVCTAYMYACMYVCD